MIHSLQIQLFFNFAALSVKGKNLHPDRSKLFLQCYPNVLE